MFNQGYILSERRERERWVEGAIAWPFVFTLTRLTGVRNCKVLDKTLFQIIIIKTYTQSKTFNLYEMKGSYKELQSLMSLIYKMIYPLSWLYLWMIIKH